MDSLLPRNHISGPFAQATIQGCLSFPRLAEQMGVFPTEAVLPSALQGWGTWVGETRSCWSQAGHFMCYRFTHANIPKATTLNFRISKWGLQTYKAK